MDFISFNCNCNIDFGEDDGHDPSKSLIKPDLASSYDHINLSDLLNQTSTGHTLNFCIYKILYRSIKKYKNKVRVNFEIWEKSASRAICSLQIDHCVRFLFVCLLWPVFYIFLFFLSGDPLIQPLSCNLKSPLSMNFSLKYANLLIIQQHLIVGNLNHWACNLGPNFRHNLALINLLLMLNIATLEDRWLSWLPRESPNLCCGAKGRQWSRFDMAVQLAEGEDQRENYWVSTHPFRLILSSSRMFYYILF